MAELKYYIGICLESPGALRTAEVWAQFLNEHVRNVGLEHFRWTISFGDRMIVNNELDGIWTEAALV